MLIRRKKAKPYGTKKLIEGTFKAGDSCVIIEDVIMSGGSILKVARDLRSQGLVVNEAYVVLDREQGGKHNIEICGIKVKSLFTLTQFMQYLFEAGKVTSKDVIRIESYLREFTAPVVKTIEPGKLFIHSLFIKRKSMLFIVLLQLSENVNNFRYFF